MQHRTIWLLAAVCVLIAIGVALVRYGLAAREAQARQDLLESALLLLDNDPGADRHETQRVLRRAAVMAEDEDRRDPESLYILGQQYVREMDFIHAEELFRAAIDAAPDWANPHAALGRLLSRNAVGRLDEAQAELNLAIELAPGWWDPYDSLAILHRMEGELHAAYDAASKAVELAPDLLAPHNNFANLLVSMEKYDEAEAEYRAAIALNDGHPKPYYNLACLFAIQGDKDQALMYLDEAIARLPELRLEAATDPDFKTMRKDDRFKELVAEPVEEEGAGEGEPTVPVAGSG